MSFSDDWIFSVIKRRSIAALLLAISHFAVATVCFSQLPSTSPEQLEAASKIQFDLDKFVPFGVDPESVKPGAVTKLNLPEQPPGQSYPDVGMATQPAYVPDSPSPNLSQFTGQSIPMVNQQFNAPTVFNDSARWQFSFYRAPWETVIKNFAQQNGFSLIVNSLPPGEFNYFDQRSYTLQEAIDILNDHLIPLGHLMVRNQNKLTVIARQNGIYEGIAPFVSMRDVAMLSRNELATVAFPIKTQSQQTIMSEMQQLLSSMGSARVLTNSNRLIVTDTGAYLARVRDLLGGYGLAAGEQDTVVIQLRNTKAESIATTLNQRLAEASAVRTASTADPSTSGGPISAIIETNCLVLSGNNDELARLQSLIAEIDRAPAQVVIQGLLVEVNLGNTNELGAELGLQDSVLFDRSVVDNLVTLSQTATAPNGVQTTNQNVVSQTAAPGFAFNNAALGNNVAVSPNTIGSQGLSSLGVGRVNGDLGFGGMVLSAQSNSVNILLRALAAKYKTDILSRPQIRTIDNSEALIQIGQQVPVVDGVNVTAVGSANPIIRQDRAGIILRVTPRTSPDGLIQIRVEAEKSAFRLAPGSGVPVYADAKNGNVIQAPIKDLTTAQTTVSARAGQTIVLGGMITTEEQNVHRKVPFLGDIPLVGRLFRYDKTSLARKELLIFLTPQLVICDADSEVQKTVEMQRIQINLDRATQMHGPLLDQNRFAPVEGMQIVPGTEFIVPNSIETNNVGPTGQLNAPLTGPSQNVSVQSVPMQNMPAQNASSR